MPVVKGSINGILMTEKHQRYNPIHEYESVGSYNLSLQLTDEHECVDEKTIVIEVQGFDLSSMIGKKCSMLLAQTETV